MSELKTLGESQLQALEQELLARYEEFSKQELALDMTRGKPSLRQLNLSNAILEYPGVTDYTADDGTDCRNYGGLTGIPKMKKLFADLLEVTPDQVVVGGNSSLTMMHDALVRACLFGVPGGEGPWVHQGPLKFLCPSPGYDRHFAITEHLGFELISVDMTDTGPDMEQVTAAVAEDASVKGIWCVPKYSNPTGVTYSDEVVHALAGMQTAAPDFRVMWDNAYAEHYFSDKPDELANIYAVCAEAGNEDRVLMFASTSKMTLAGSGVAAIAASPANIDDALNHLAVQFIGPDKLNQLRHARFFGDIGGLRAHMRQHAELIKPKFDIVHEVLREELEDKNIATWTKPNGGYFISLDVWDGCAKQVIQLAGEIGVSLTNAGAPFPYGKDPRDCNIRIAPTFPRREEIKLSTEILAICIQLAAVRKLLGKADDSDTGR